MYDELMYEGQGKVTFGGPNVVMLDNRSSSPEAPYGIITADCSNPKEIDDGIFVEALPSEHEAYRVHVFTVDASKLYFDGAITQQVLKNTEARYLSPSTKTEAYLPMLEESQIRYLEFTKGRPKSALSVSFVVGPDVAPDNVEIGYGKIEVQKSFRYDQFGKSCRWSESFFGYGRAAAAIMHHLGFTDSTQPREHPSFEAAYHSLIHVPKHEKYKRGAYINQAFMVAACYFVARSMRDEPLAIFRVHDLNDTSFEEFIDSRLARFSTTPGPHHGLGLDVYTRVTSPLRRAEDFMMHGLLRARHEGRQLTGRDHKLVKETVQRLNQRIALNAFKGKTDLGSDDQWQISQ